MKKGGLDVGIRDSSEGVGVVGGLSCPRMTF